MALKATIFKAELQIADMDRNYYHDHALTIARHPSETDERMMVRVLAYALHAHEALSFGKGLSTDDEPDLWQKDLTGAIELWIDVGQPDEKRIAIEPEQRLHGLRQGLRGSIRQSGEETGGQRSATRSVGLCLDQVGPWNYMTISGCGEQHRL